MTSINKTTTAAQKLQELNAKIDAAMTGKGPHTAAELQEESVRFAGLQGGEAGDLSRRLRHLKEKDQRERDELVVATIPKLIDMADGFKARYDEGVEYVDMMDQVEYVLGGVEFFAMDELRACDPVLVAGARRFQESSHIAFQALGKYLLLSIIKEHPEVMHMAAERAHAWLHEALMKEAR